MMRSLQYLLLAALLGIQSTAAVPTNLVDRAARTKPMPAPPSGNAPPVARSTPGVAAPNGGPRFMDRQKLKQAGVIDVPVMARSLEEADFNTLDDSTPLGQILNERARVTKPGIISKSTVPCVGNEGNDTYISSLFYYGGAGTTVFLCPNSKISLTNAVFFTAANQTLATAGYPTDNSRATLTVTGQNQSCAVYGLWGTGYDRTTLRNVIIDGGRETLGMLNGGIALIEMGGMSIGQQIISVKAFEPRGWSALHAIEGINLYCSGMQILNNQIGPAGHAPSGATQFKRDTGTYTPGQWADGISMACKGSTVSGNVVTDATDGGIVVFGAPGSVIKGNTIIANQRQLMGGINMVDWAPFSGSFVGTTVTGNAIQASGSMIKIGIAVGGLTWGGDNRTLARTYGGSVTNNMFTSGSSYATGYFGYSVAIAGHENATISGNQGRNTNYGGVMSSACVTQLPLAQPGLQNPWTTPGCTLQPGFFQMDSAFIICGAPGAIQQRMSSW